MSRQTKRSGARQAGSGYDISCGVVYLRVPDLHASDVADWDKRGAWIDDVELRIATGIGSHRPKHMPRLNDSKVEEILRYGAKAIGAHASVCERQYIPVDETHVGTFATLVVTRFGGLCCRALATEPDRESVADDRA